MDEKYEAFHKLKSKSCWFWENQMWYFHKFVQEIFTVLISILYLSKHYFGRCCAKLTEIIFLKLTNFLVLLHNFRKILFFQFPSISNYYSWFICHKDIDLTTFYPKVLPAKNLHDKLKWKKVCKRTRVQSWLFLDDPWCRRFRLSSLTVGVS